MLKKIFVGLIGPGEDKCTNEIFEFGLKLGRYLIDNEYFIVCGGKGGFMEAVCKGAHGSMKYSFGSTIGIIPEDDKKFSNRYVDTVIPTGSGVSRNVQIINSSDILIAVGGGSGTLSEIAFAWQKAKRVLCHSEFSGWAQRLAGIDIDDSHKNLLIPFSELDDIHELIKSYI